MYVIYNICYMHIYYAYTCTYTYILVYVYCIYYECDILSTTHQIYYHFIIIMNIHIVFSYLTLFDNIIQYTLLTYVLYSIFYIRYIYVSYQSHLITFVALPRCLHSRSSRSCHQILILLYCHLLTRLQT